MDNIVDIEARLWEYIDGQVSNQEADQIKRLIDENTAWRAKYQELLEVHQLINATELEEPSLRFTKNVMEEIARLHIAPAAKNYINKKIIWGIAIFFITLIVGYLGYGFSQVDWSAKGSDFSLTDRIGSMDYGMMFNNNFVNAFMMINVLLGLMLLDRYLSNKRKEFQDAL